MQNLVTTRMYPERNVLNVLVCCYMEHGEINKCIKIGNKTEINTQEKAP